MPYFFLKYIFTQHARYLAETFCLVSFKDNSVKTGYRSCTKVPDIFDRWPLGDTTYHAFGIGTIAHEGYQQCE